MNNFIEFILTLLLAALVIPMMYGFGLLIVRIWVIMLTGLGVL